MWFTPDTNIKSISGLHWESEVRKCSVSQVNVSAQGVGFDRSSKGTDAVGQYPEPYRSMYDNIDRALLRGGITDPVDVRLRLEDSQFPNEVDVLLDMECENLSDLNALAQAADSLSDSDMNKLGAVVMLAKPKSAAQIKNLAENLDLFDFAPGAHSPAEYGKYMIRQSGRFEYDENLDAFYDYEKYGTERMNEEDGMFTDRGYVAYKGFFRMEEVLSGSQSSHMVMGGLSR